MNPNFSIPVVLSLLAFFVADSENELIQQIFKRSLTAGNRTSIEERLTKLGRNSKEDFENFRISQLTYIAIGFTLTTFALFLGVLNWTLYLLSLPAITLVVLFLTEKDLTQRCQERVRGIEGEFPAVIEMLTLAVGAGESPAMAIKRISKRANGHLAHEFKSVIHEIENGRSFTSSLDDLSNRLASDAIRRFVDSLAISIARGSSLVETLGHSAHEARNLERVRLLTAAGKSEISMMIPVVFLILPVSILFALYPSLANLNLFGSS
jgi:tight adherence protein C